MSSDEDQIRSLVHRWQSASQAGDTETVLGLMTDDAVFLTPGRPPMDKREFAALSTHAPGATRPTLESSQQILEIEVCGHLAYLWSALSVSITPLGVAQAIERTGHTLTVFKKVDGRWLLARDANLLALRPQTSGGTGTTPTC